MKIENKIQNQMRIKYKLLKYKIPKYLNLKNLKNNSRASHEQQCLIKIQKMIYNYYILTSIYY